MPRWVSDRLGRELGALISHIKLMSRNSKIVTTAREDRRLQHRFSAPLAVMVTRGVSTTTSALDRASRGTTAQVSWGSRARWREGGVLGGVRGKRGERERDHFPLHTLTHIRHVWDSLVGSNDRRMHRCGGETVYCPEGSASPTSVASGHYSTGGTSTTRTGQVKCEQERGFDRICPTTVVP